MQHNVKWLYGPNGVRRELAGMRAVALLSITNPGDRPIGSRDGD
jgi:hypothetical protein